MKKPASLLALIVLLGLAACAPAGDGGGPQSVQGLAQSAPQTESAESLVPVEAVSSGPPDGAKPTSETAAPPLESGTPGMEEDTPAIPAAPKEPPTPENNLVLPLVEALLLPVDQRFTWLSEASVDTYRSPGYRAFTIPYTTGGYEGILMASFTTWSEIELVAQTALSNDLAFRCFAAPEESFMEAVAALEALGAEDWFSEHDYPADGVLAEGMEYYRYGTFTYQGHAFGAFVQLATKGGGPLYDQLEDDQWPVFQFSVEIQDEWIDLEEQGK